MGAVAVVSRISKDKEGRAEGVETQQQRGTQYAREHWPGQPVAYFTDNDLTAADPDVVRPGFQALLQAVRRGEIEQIVCAEQSRLTRQPAEWEQLMVTLTRAGITEIHQYRKGVVEIGRSKLVGRILAAVDAEEVEVLKARINERMESVASAGRPHGGTPFAYRHVLLDGRKHLEPIPDRAQIVRECAERVLSGWSLSAVASSLNDRQIPTARGGKRWGPSTVKSLLTNPTVTALRTHRGRLVEGTWEPVLDRDTWRHIGHLLTAPVVLSTERGVYRATRARNTPRRRYLLTGGVAVCGVCGAPMAGQQRQARDKSRVPIYSCHPATGGCSRVSILAVPLEEHVADELCRELDRPGFWDAYTTDDGERSRLLGELAVVRQAKVDQARRFGLGEVGQDEWDALRSVLTERQSVLEAALSGLPPALQPISGAELRTEWAGMELAERRAAVDRLRVSVTVAPARPGARGFDKGRVRVDFR